MHNTAKNTDFTSVDPELMHQINSYIDYPIFIVRDHIHTKDELTQLYQFEELGITPEELFVRQVIYVYGDGITRDFVSADVSADVPTKSQVETIMTNIYIAKEAWDDFQTMQKLARGFARFGNIGFMDRLISAEKPKLQIADR